MSLVSLYIFPPLVSCRIKKPLCWEQLHYKTRHTGMLCIFNHSSTQTSDILCRLPIWRPTTETPHRASDLYSLVTHAGSSRLCIFNVFYQQIFWSVWGPNLANCVFQGQWVYIWTMNCPKWESHIVLTEVEVPTKQTESRYFPNRILF